MRIGIFGDIHRSFDHFSDALHQIVKSKNIEAAIQLGDFGISRELAGHALVAGPPVPLHVLDGNHEDFKYLNRIIKDDTLRQWVENGFFYHPRGSVYEFPGMRAGFIGGALNVDQPQKRGNGNVITNNEINLAMKTFSENCPDIIFSHSCPAGIGIGMKGHHFHASGVANYIIMAGYDPGPHLDYGEVQLTHLWEGIDIKPKIWLFGHFHQYRQVQIDETRFLCLPRFDLHGEFVVLNTETLEMEFFSLDQ